METAGVGDGGGAGDGGGSGDVPGYFISAGISAVYNHYQSWPST